MNIGLLCSVIMVYYKETWKERLQQIILIKVKLKGRLHLGEHRFAVLCDHGSSKRNMEGEVAANNTYKSKIEGEVAPW